MTCDHCSSDAVVISPGSDETREFFLLVREVPRRNWCMPCAQLAGWPWIAVERQKKSKGKI